MNIPACLTIIGSDIEPKKEHIRRCIDIKLDESTKVLVKASYLKRYWYDSSRKRIIEKIGSYKTVRILIVPMNEDNNADMPNPQPGPSFFIRKKVIKLKDIKKDLETWCANAGINSDILFASLCYMIYPPRAI